MKLVFCWAGKNIANINQNAAFKFTVQYEEAGLDSKKRTKEKENTSKRNTVQISGKSYLKTDNCKCHSLDMKVDFKKKKFRSWLYN